MQRYINSLASTSTGLPLVSATVTVGYYPQGTGSVTTPIASPGVVDWTAHSMIAGQPFVPQGIWPTGVTVGTVYYVLPTGLTVNSFEMSATPGGAPINFTVSAGSGQFITAPIYSTNNSSNTYLISTSELTSDINGAFGFYAPDGRYQLSILPSGGSTTILSDILLDDVIDGIDIALAISGAPVKATPVGADALGIWDSVTGLLKNLSFTNLLSWLQGITWLQGGWAGIVVAWPTGAAIPSGWLLCPTAQTLVSLSTYPGLSVLGTTFGGDGVTTVGLPFYPAGYVPVQGTPGVLTHGALLAHAHLFGNDPGFGAAGGGTQITSHSSNLISTSSTGGSDNLAAGIGSQFIIKY